jgi:hypothetical protein
MPSRNPLTSEDAAFRWLVYLVVGAVVLVAIVLLLRALL